MTPDTKEENAYYQYIREQWVYDFLATLGVGLPDERDMGVRVMTASLRAIYDLQQQITTLQEQVDDLSATVVHLRNS